MGIIFVMLLSIVNIVPSWELQSLYFVAGTHNIKKKQEARTIVLVCSAVGSWLYVAIVACGIWQWLPQGT